MCAYVSVSCANTVLKICSLSGFSHTYKHTYTHTFPQGLTVLLQVLPIHQPINRQHICFFCGMQWCSLVSYPTKRVNKCASSPRGSHRCCDEGVVAPRGARSQSSSSIMWEKRSWEEVHPTAVNLLVFNKPFLVIKCTCCVCFFSPVTAGIILLQLAPNIANYKRRC